ncbi:hypothetical protein P3342_010451 [Pyrenophora teres f. teres]|nr:hypothetical protein P3342_010451 [Pyrenophora teres f. teres]
MPSSSHRPRFLNDASLDATAPSLTVISTVLLVVVSVIAYSIINNSKSEYPLANPPRWYQTSLSKRMEFLKEGHKFFENAKKTFVRMHSEKRLSFAAIIRVDFHGHLPGFGPYNLLMHKNMLAQTLIRKRLTKSLNGLVEPLSTETAFAVKTVFGETSVFELYIEKQANSSIHSFSFIVALRQEIVDVFRVEGMTSAALSKMKLLDSALKEGIRVVPMASLNIRRGATADFVTPDGVEIKKSDRLFVDATKVTDPNVYPEPAKYDIYRYYNIRDNAITAAKAQLVGTTAENLAFGYGVHACPGRFFAANENKLILCHLLLKYAWELCPGSTLEAYPLVSTMFGLDPNVKIRYRSRKPELDLVPL